MNEIVKVTTKGNQQTVSARELHKALEVVEKFSAWFERVCNTLNINENEYGRCTFPTKFNRYFKDFALPIRIAKEICMVSRSKKSSAIRGYFIRCEEAWNSEEMILMRANQIMQSKMISYEQQIVELSSTVSMLTHDREETFYMKDIAKELKMSDIQLYKELVNDVLYKQHGKYYHYKNRGFDDWFVYSDDIVNGNVYRVLKVTGVGKLGIINKMRTLFDG